MNQSTNYSGQHIFSQIVSLCSRSIISPVVKVTGSDRYYKRLRSFEHFVSMLYCVMSGSTSLREIEAGLSVAKGKINHLGIDYVPPRSTLSDGNKLRPSSFFKAIYTELYKRYRPSLSDSTLPKSVVDNLFLMDSTVFSLFKAILKTSGRHSLDGRKKGGIKKNTIIEGRSLMPSFIQFSAAADNDQRIYPSLSLPKGSYLVFDKGYTDYAQYAQLGREGIFFITRQKENAAYTSLAEKDPGEGTSPNVLRDETITQTYKDASGQVQSLVIRRIAWWDEKNRRAFEFITNAFDLEAEIIAQIYKFRWKIELFFKKLKQNFPLQYFVGDNVNAIEIQIWCALIALLLLSTLHSQHKSKLAFTVFITVIRLHLFNYIGLKDLNVSYQRKRGERAPSDDPDLFSTA